MRKSGLLWSGIPAVLVLVLLAGCATIPPPKAAGDSLLVILAYRGGAQPRPTEDVAVLSGPVTERLNLLSTSNGVIFLRVPAGTYTLRSRTIRWRGGARESLSGFANRKIAVQAASIVLPSWKFSAVRKGGRKTADALAPVTPKDRRSAAADLADYVRAVDWSGRRVVGFRPYSPFRNFVQNEYTIAISSSPPGSSVSIDDESWGRTPLPVHLAAGKHFVRLAHTGYAPYSAFIDVRGNGKENFELKKAAAAQTGSKRAVSLMIEPFSNLGSSGYDNLEGVLTSSLAVALRHSGVRMVKAAKAANRAAAAAGGTPLPNFAEAERAGAQAFVAGDYLATGDSILIHAALYDTRTGLVKTSLLFNGQAGLQVFDSIDEMSMKFGASLAKVLPEVGQSVIQERVVSPAVEVFRTRIAQQEVISKRERHGVAVSVGVGVDHMTDAFTAPGQSVPRIPGGSLYGVHLGLDLPMTKSLMFHLATNPFVFRNYLSQRQFEVPVYFGPRYYLPGFMNEVYFGLQGDVHYAPQFAVTTSTTYGPFVLAGAGIDTGIRIYTYTRSSQLPSFIGIGLTLSVVGYRFDLSGASPTTYYPLEGQIRMVWGTRL